MKRLFIWIAHLTVCFLLCTTISILPQLLLPDNRLGITSISDPAAWQLYIGDIDALPPASKPPAMTAGTGAEAPLASAPQADFIDWLPLSEQIEHMNQIGYTGAYWLKRTLPPYAWKDPYLWVQNQTNFELYISHKPSFYSSYMHDGIPSSLTLFFNLHLIPLQPDFSGQTLYIRAFTDGQHPLLGTLQIGTNIAFYESMLNKDKVKLVLTVLFAAFFVISLCLYFLNRKEQAYFYFSLFSLNMVYISWMQSYLSHTLFDLSAIYVIKDITAPISLLSLLGFQEALFEKSKYVTLMRKWRYIMLAFTGACIAAAFIHTGLYELLITKVLLILFIFILYTGIRGILFYRPSNAGQRNREVNLIIFGFIIMSIFTSIHMLIEVNSPLSYLIKSTLPSAFWGYDQVLVGCFVFDICLGMILLYRFTETYKRVKEYATQLESRNQDLKVLNDLKDDFLAKTSHELRTPLYGIMGITEALLDGSTGRIDETAHKQLSLVAYSGQRLTHLINDILDHFKLKHQAVELSLKPVGMKQVVDIVLGTLKPQADRKNLLLHNEIRDDVPFVAVDEDRILQVLFNLAANAIQFTKHGKISVLAEAIGNTLKISIADSGIGIPAEFLSKIWEPFEQVDNRLSRTYGGTGLGLAISKQLVQLHGGDIHVESTPGQGSVFSFTVPLWKAALTELAAKDIVKGKTPVFSFLEDAVFMVESEIASGGRAKIEQYEPGKNKPSILIVDDEWLNLEVLSAHLSSLYTVSKAASAAEALQWIDKFGPPNLIISDLMMPDMTGYDLSVHIRQKYHPGELPFLLLSAKNQTNDIVEGFNAGINDYLSKPVAKGELLSRVHLHLELSKLNHTLEDQVKQRTEDLEQSYRQLQLSMRETFEMMGEVTIWEERNRIAHEIHDILGHKLTVTIVQLEATKRLMATNPELALEKLELAQESVRRGLHDISDAVHTVKQDSKRADIHASLLGLIQETESMSGVTIEFDIGKLPALNALQKKVLYHALQEGLTNGIKHGGSKRFMFQLREEAEQLHFSLVNIGKPYTNNAPGFGLTAMSDKVGHLGGMIHLRAIPHQGSELQLAFPLSFG
jgi:two-component system sensor histidine kinase ChiS